MKLMLFQSTLPHGSDVILYYSGEYMVIFQSTLPHGSDINFSFNLICIKNFNPRSLTGATLF